VTTRGCWSLLLAVVTLKLSIVCACTTHDPRCCYHTEPALVQYAGCFWVPARFPCISIADFHGCFLRTCQLFQSCSQNAWSFSTQGNLSSFDCTAQKESHSSTVPLHCPHDVYHILPWHGRNMFAWLPCLLHTFSACSSFHGWRDGKC
jgi:hypothetical protein